MKPLVDSNAPKSVGKVAAGWSLPFLTSYYSDLSERSVEPKEINGAAALKAMLPRNPGGQVRPCSDACQMPAR